MHVHSCVGYFDIGGRVGRSLIPLVRFFSHPKRKTNVLSMSAPTARFLVPVPRPLSEISDSFALVVQKHRKAKGLSRASLVTGAGLHQTYIGLLERADRSPSLDTAQSIARALGVSLSQLITEAEKLHTGK